MSLLIFLVLGSTFVLAAENVKESFYDGRITKEIIVKGKDIRFNYKSKTPPPVSDLSKDKELPNELLFLGTHQMFEYCEKSGFSPDITFYYSDGQLTEFEFEFECVGKLPSKKERRKGLPFYYCKKFPDNKIVQDVCRDI